MFEHDRLRGKIIEKFGSQKRFTELMGISDASMSYKMTGKREFTSSEISKAIEILNIDPHHIYEYFFNKKV